MFHEILAFIVNLLIVDPLQAEMDKRLAEARAPQAVIADVRACADAALPILTDRAVSEPGWVATTALDVWLGRTAPEDVLTTIAPRCNAPVRAAKGYLQGQST
ncbi:hypothetical protein [Microvirga pakistanensis]|uniref:hypothetical protein n=1 Tax=Microvirga pakistanensis TaxID=1682650 RepID=UPI00106AAA05|nr:hypothetical protein [Microvirga pakistanensis]